MSAERTISQNLELLAQTKASLMNAINAKGGEITSSTPFSAYSAAIAALDVNVYSIEVLDITSYEEQETLENNINYDARLMNNGNQVNEPMYGSWSFNFMPTDYDGTDYSSNISEYDDQFGQVDNTFSFLGLPDGQLTIIYYDSNNTELALVTLPVVGESQQGQYRLEIYNDMGKDNGTLCDPDDIRPMTRYSVYLYDIANETYLEDAIDWDLITDDDGTLIVDISDGDLAMPSLSSCVSMFTNMGEGTTVLHAVNPSDHSDVYADLAITVIGE